MSLGTAGAVLLICALVAKAHATPIPVANSFFDLPATGLPTNTTTHWNEADNPAITGWSLSIGGGPPTGGGVQVGGQPGQLPGHHQSYGRVYDPGVGLVTIRQDVGPLVPNTAYTLTVGVAAGDGSADRVGYGTLGLVEGDPEGFGYFYAISSFAVGGSFVDQTVSFTTGSSVSGHLGIALDVNFGPSTGSGAFNEVDFQNVRLDATPVPEPSALALAAVGGIGLLRLRLARTRARRPPADHSCMGVHGRHPTTNSQRPLARRVLPAHLRFHKSYPLTMKQH